MIKILFLSLQQKTISRKVYTECNVIRRFIFFAFCIPLLTHAQSINQNYVKETQHLDSLGACITNVSYYNGLGDLVETASTACGSSDALYTLRSYDSKGREEKVWSPTPVGNALDYIDPAAFKNASERFYNDACSYRQNHYDANDHLIREDIAGKTWHDHNAHNEHTYGTNTDADRVLCYNSASLSSRKYFPAGTLEKESLTDADGHQVTFFKNLYGNTVLERRPAGDTYYVYNGKGQLVYVLPPKYQQDPDLSAYAYQYEYDKYDHLVRKKFPGAQYVQYWYDKEDYVAFEQDPQLREAGLYRFYLYDRLGRVVVEGTAPSCKTNVIYAEQIVNYTSSPGFLNTGYSSVNIADIIGTAGATVDKVYYYDSYDFLNGAHSADYAAIVPTTKGNVNGLLAGSMVRATDGEYIYTVNCYDPTGNLTRRLTKGLKGYISDVSNSYTLTNQLSSSVAEINVKYGDKLRVSQTNEYSKRNDLLARRAISINHGASSDSCSISYEYDAINRLKSVVRPEKAGRVSYEYDVHGWPVKIESNSFKESLFYADGVGKSCYNGDISSLMWQNNNYSQPRGYRFLYDDADRLTSASYAEGASMSQNAGRFDEQAEYDVNGNIISLIRNGKTQDDNYGAIDKLSVSLSGNQVSSVTDDAAKLVYPGAIDLNVASNGKSDYRYNESGALISDTGRGITIIDYDHHGNPSRIQFSNGNVTKYIYSADGEKLRTIYYTAMPNMHVQDGTIHELNSAETQSVDSLDYLLGGSLILKNGRISKYLFDGGYCEALPVMMCIARPRHPFLWGGQDDNLDDSFKVEWNHYQEMVRVWTKMEEANQNKDEFSFYFYNKDHVGNNREVVDQNGNIWQVTNYYPYGTPYSDPSATINSEYQPYKYNGKELDLMHGLNTYDYGARQYNSVLPMWDRIDPLAEKYYSVSPYAYCKNNPVNLIDVKGLFPTEEEAWKYAKDHKVSLGNVHYAYDRNEWFVAFGKDGGSYSTGYELERRFHEKVSESSLWNKISDFNTDISTGLGFAGWGLAKPLSRSNAYVLKDITGRYVNSIKPTFRFRNIDIDLNLRYVNYIASGIETLGLTCGVVSGLMTGYEIWQGQKNLVGEGGLDLIMTGVGFLPVYGWAVSSAYFLGKSAFEKNHMDFWNK